MIRCTDRLTRHPRLALPLLIVNGALVAATFALILCLVLVPPSSRRAAAGVAPAPPVNGAGDTLSGGRR